MDGIFFFYFSEIVNEYEMYFCHLSFKIMLGEVKAMVYHFRIDIYLIIRNYWKSLR